MSLLIPNNKPLDIQKDLAENALAEAFARDLITMEELERRLHKIQEAHSNSEISVCLNDLPEDLLVPVEAQAPVQAVSKTEKKQSTILSSNLMCGAKLKNRNINTKVVLGELTLDYSKTLLEPGKYYINLTCILGETKIIIPPEYSVTTEIQSILAEVKDRSTTEPASNIPEIIVTGKAILGEISIREKGTGFIEKIKKLFLE